MERSRYGQGREEGREGEREAVDVFTGGECESLGWLFGLDIASLRCACKGNGREGVRSEHMCRVKQTIYLYLLAKTIVII